MYIPSSKEEEIFLRDYQPGNYEKPSVTVDIVVLTIIRDVMHVLFVKRGGFPYKDHWAIPGGFVDMSESIEHAAERELFEETGLSNIPVHQFGTFGDVDRDPRMRVISVAYMAFVPAELLKPKAGDDASDVQFFEIRKTDDGPAFIGPRNVLKESDLAFDHAKILKRAISMLKNRIDYTDDAFAFLNDQDFTIYELQKIVEAAKGHKENLTNFRRIFFNKYLRTGLVVETGETSARGSKKPAKTYRKLKS